MKRLLETTDQALVEGLRLALESEGIEARFLVTGVSGMPFIPTIVSVHEEDWDRARDVLRSLQE